MLSVISGALALYGAMEFAGSRSRCVCSVVATMCIISKGLFCVVIYMLRACGIRSIYSICSIDSIDIFLIVLIAGGKGGGGFKWREREIPVSVKKIPVIHGLLEPPPVAPNSRPR